MIMASMSIVEFLRDKNILIVGATGFLGKVFVEKILRLQPDVARIFIMMRATNLQSAQAKLQNQLIFKGLFKLLREHYEDDYERFMEQKVVPVVGDVAFDGLGMQQCIMDELQAKIDIMVNMAATTTFDERYDIAMNVNTLGAKRIVDFCKRCQKLQILCHVSTAYVNVGKSGIVTEDIVKDGAEKMGRWEIDTECDLIRRTLKEIGRTNSEEADRQMKELGLHRARKFGWPNAYVFTKAMGEMMVDRFREDLPTVVIRPSIIESTLTEPFPGWMEGNRMIDPFITGYGKGRISSMPLHPNLILDVVPADMVVSSTIASISRHASESGLFVYHVATSVANPLFYDVIANSTYKYFSSHPWKDNKGNLVKVRSPRFIHSMSSFKRYMTLRYNIPLQILRIMDKILCGLLRQQYNRLLRRYRFAINLVELYEPFLFFDSKFDNSNTDFLWRELCREDKQTLNFDVTCIDWNHYFFNVHIPSIVKVSTSYKYSGAKI